MNGFMYVRDKSFAKASDPFVGHTSKSDWLKSGAWQNHVAVQVFGVLFSGLNFNGVFIYKYVLFYLTL